MRIGINARRLAGQRLGIGRYTEYLLKYWNQMLMPSETVTLYLREALAENEFQLSSAFKTKVLNPRLTGVLWENLLLPPRASELDVLFCPSYTAPLMYKGRYVVANHSTNEVEKGAHDWTYNWTYRPYYRLAALRAEVVIVPCRTVKEDIQKHYGVPEDRIEIVMEGADDTFQPITDENILRATRQKYLGEDVPYVLFVGKHSERRNVPLLLRAFAAAKKKENLPHKLLLMGPNIHRYPLDQMASDLGIADSLVRTNPIFTDHRDIIPVYSAADLYAFPSAYEGYSLTVCEAMACGLPVVAANRAAVAEIAGGYGFLIDEITVEALSDAIGKVLTDRELWADLRAKSLVRASQLRWKTTAQQTLDILRKAA